MRDFLTACELCSGIIPRFPERLFAVRDSLRRVDCSRGLSAATLPRKIVCNAGFPDGLWITVGDHRPPRSPEDCLPCGIPCGVWIAVGNYSPLPRRLFAMKDSSRRVDCSRGSFAAQENSAEKRYFYNTGGAEKVVSPPPPPRFAHRIGFFTAARCINFRFGPYLCNTPKGIDYILYNTKIDLL